MVLGLNRKREWGDESKIFELSYFIGLATFGKFRKGIVNKNFSEKEGGIVVIGTPELAYNKT